MLCLAARMFSRRRIYISVALLLTIVGTTAVQPHTAVALDSAFVRRWTQDDATVASGEEQHSWTWGPLVLRSGREPYAQSPDGRREVWYFDKGRMEVTHPEADTDNDWYITSGLIVRELISGRIQLGDDTYEQWQPASVPVAGDIEAPPATTITYADLRQHATIDGEDRAEPRSPDAGPILDVLSPGGAVAEDDAFATYQVQNTTYDDVTGHNIAGVFLTSLGADTLLYLAGRPLSEPYWARVPVNHTPQDVLIQPFERRILTYTPANPEAWQIEWGNAGRQYLQWRFGQADDGTSFNPASLLSTSSTVRQLRERAPAAAKIAVARKGFVAAAVIDTDTGAFFSFQGTRQFPMYSIAKVPIMLAVLDRAVRENRRAELWEQNLIESMIQVSDNGAASQLLESVGGAPAVNRYLRRIGINNTTFNSEAWGESTTTAQDMARLMTKLGTCSILIPRLCRYALQTMQHVIPSQRWGVSAAAPSSASVSLKNGWYPQNNGWAINSIGLITSPHKQIAIAVLTKSDPSQAYGQTTTERVSAEIGNAIFGP